MVADNVAEKISPLSARQPAEAQRLPFSAGELRDIFDLPLFTGSVDDQRGFNKSGPNLVRGSRYWLPLIALFTGMRMGEILQLTPDHIRTSESGTPFIVLTRGMKLKTGNASREIPIHPQLVDLGFLEWVEQRREAGAELLFDDVPEGKHGYASDIFTKRFATMLRAVPLAAERKSKLCFHSFRHTFKDALNETDASEEEKDEICGWSRGNKTGRRYGSGLSADKLKPYVDAVSYNLDFAEMKAAYRRQAKGAEADEKNHDFSCARVRSQRSPNKHRFGVS